MTKPKEFVEVLSEKYPIEFGCNEQLKAIITMFWLNVEKLATEQEIEQMGDARTIADKLWSNYNELPQFECDYEAAKYF